VRSGEPPGASPRAAAPRPARVAGHRGASARLDPAGAVERVASEPGVTPERALSDVLELTRNPADALAAVVGWRALWSLRRQRERAGRARACATSTTGCWRRAHRPAAAGRAGFRPRGVGRRARRAVGVLGGAQSRRGRRSLPAQRKPSDGWSGLQAAMGCGGSPGGDGPRTRLADDYSCSPRDRFRLSPRRTVRARHHGLRGVLRRPAGHAGGVAPGPAEPLSHVGRRPAWRCTRSRRTRHATSPASAWTTSASSRRRRRRWTAGTPGCSPTACECAPLHAPTATAPAASTAMTRRARSCR